MGGGRGNKGGRLGGGGGGNEESIQSRGSQTGKRHTNR